MVRGAQQPQDLKGRGNDEGQEVDERFETRLPVRSRGFDDVAVTEEALIYVPNDYWCIHLETILKARPKAPKTMKDSLRPILGTC